MPKKLTQEQVIEQFVEKHGDKYIYDKVNYIDNKTKVLIGCRVEGHGYFEQEPSNHKNGSGCLICGKSVNLSKEEVVQQFKEVHGDMYSYDRVEYINAKTKVLIGCKVENHGYFEQTPTNHKNGQGCLKCANKNRNKQLKITDEEIKNIYDTTHVKIVDINRDKDECGNLKSVYIKYKCLKYNCGHIDVILLRGTTKQIKCSKCAEKTRKNYTVFLADKKPDLIKYFVDENLPYLVKISSKEKVQLICPDCGHLKPNLISVRKFASKPFYCQYCSDGISVPEKFVANLLRCLDASYTPQYSTDWSNSYRYDFYIPKINTIIEVHGMQHYKDSSGHFKNRTFEEVLTIDIEKQNLAVNNGVKNYIIIDARKSELDWLRNNCINSLIDYFDIDNIDWNSIWETSQKSIIPQVWNAWNNKSEYENIKTLALKFDVCESTIKRYLKSGRSIGKVN